MNMTQKSILLVDDDDKLLRVMTLRLESEGYSVIVAGGGDEALERLQERRPNFVLADLRMPGMDGLELLSHIQVQCPDLPVAILTAYGDVPDTVRAIHSGAVDFLLKPVERDKLVECIRRYLVADEEAEGWARGFVTRSPLLRAVLGDARRVARSDAAVLIHGAGGTGKELLARSIHAGSARTNRPFISINCAAISTEALERELFGDCHHSAGVHDDHIGLFRAADGGTVFFKNIGILPLELQVKLLQVLQDREFRPPGELGSAAVDVRVLAATCDELPARIAASAFRQDLYDRLNVVSLQLPALEQRREDIPLLTSFHLSKMIAAGAPRRYFSAEAMEVLTTAAWPGNVRQLFNVIDRNAALARAHVIGAAQVRQSIGEQPVALPQLDQARSEFTRNYLRQLLEVAGGNISRAARLAGRNRTDFYKLMSRHGVDPSRYKSGERGAPSVNRT